MKNKDIYRLLEGIRGLKNEQGAKFAYKLAKNEKLLEIEVQSLEEIRSYSDGMREYESKRLAICIEHAKKDESGNPVIEFQNYVIDQERMEDFKKAMADLQEQYKETLDEQKKKMDEYDAFLNEETSAEELGLRKIFLSDIPDTVTAEKLKLIEEIIED